MHGAKWLKKEVQETWGGGDGQMYPVQARLVHALGVLFELKVLPVDARRLDVSGQVGHVGDPGHGSL